MEDRVLGVLTLVLYSVHAVARVRPTETFLTPRIPIQDRGVHIRTGFARTELFSDVDGIVGCLIETFTLERFITVIFEMKERELLCRATVCDPIVIPARMCLTNTRLLLLAVVQDGEPWVWARAASAEFGHPHRG